MMNAAADDESATAPGAAETLASLFAWGMNELAAAGIGSRLDVELLLAECTGAARSTIIAFGERVVDAPAAARFRQALARRASGVPLAQIVGHREFYSLPLAVTEATLVPRPETELLVDEALARLPERPGCTVLDLGTGSGAIALAIKQVRPDVDVTAVDICEAALAVARRNSSALALQVRFVASDWFAGLGAVRFDLIAANPPYVACDDVLLRGPLRHEPRIALASGADGLDAIRSIVTAAPRYMHADTVLLIEHGSTQRDAVEALARQAGLTTLARRRDLAGRDRLGVFGLPRG